MSQQNLSDPKIIVALDFPSKDACLTLLKQLDPTLCRVKIGKEMFTLFGPALVEQIQAQGFEVFLDLKFHDIPTTVAKAVKASASLGVWMVNVHASGGEKMLTAANDALASFSVKPKLIAVTVLTSMSDAELPLIGVTNNAEEQVARLAQLTHRAGLDGVVCSAQEAATIKQLCDASFLCVTPGIRPADSASDDQQRIMTPDQALKNGSNYLVIGRPITQAENPMHALQSIFSSIQSQ